ncbi:MAG: AsmA-like C-terminal region-containing protein [Hyphomicrobiaceae bacterium]
MDDDDHTVDRPTQRRYAPPRRRDDDVPTTRRRAVVAPPEERHAEPMGPVQRLLLRTASVAAAVVLVMALAAGLLWMTLSRGPLSVQWLAEPIARQISADLDGIIISFADVTAELGEQGLELNLIDVLVSDRSGTPIARAQKAAIDLSTRALWRGLLAPRHIALVQPTVIVFTGDDGGLSFAVDRPGGSTTGAARTDGLTAAAAPQRQQPTAPLTAAGEDSGHESVESRSIVRVIVDALREAGRKRSSTSYLESFGLRTAALVVDHNGRQSIIPIHRADLSFDRTMRNRASLTGTIRFAGTHDQSIVFSASEHQAGSGGLDLTASLDRVDFAALEPNGLVIPALDRISAPITGRIEVRVAPNGAVEQGAAQLHVAGGAIIGERRPQRRARAIVEFRELKLDLRFDAATGRVDIGPSSIVTANGEATVVGTATRGAMNGGGVADRGFWSYGLRSTEGWIALETTSPAPDRVPIEGLRINGVVDVARSSLGIAQAALEIAGATLVAAGRIEGMPTSPVIVAQADVASVPSTLVARLWPRGLSEPAREWFVANVRQGRITSGRIAMRARIAPGSGAPHSAPESKSGLIVEQATAQLDIDGVAFSPLAALPIVTTPKVVVRIEGQTLEARLDRASMAIEGAPAARIDGAVYRVDALGTPEQSAEIAFKWTSEALTALRLMAKLDEDIAPDAATLQSARGVVTADLTMGLPTISDDGETDAPTAFDLSSLATTGKVALRDGSATSNRLPHAIKAASLDLELGQRLTTLRGRMLFGGVATDVAWQALLTEQGETISEPLQLRANLDDTDRRQLGLELTGLVRGVTPVTVRIDEPLKPSKTSLTVDLTAAQVSIESLGWSKPPGRPALMTSGLRRKADGSGMELHDLRITGDPIAIRGEAELDNSGALTRVRLPQFSLDGTSRIEIDARREVSRRGATLWRVSATGPSYNGRGFFRSLFRVNTTPERASEMPGLELKATISNVIGFNDISLRDVDVLLSKSNGEIQSLVATGTLTGGARLEVGLQADQRGARRLVARSPDAGTAFRLVDFYPKVRGGDMRLELNHSPERQQESSGILSVRKFEIVGNPISATAGRPGAGQTTEILPFDVMTVPFSLGHGQFVIHDADLRGPLVGGTLRGIADFENRTLNLGGTYSLLQALNTIPAILPGIDILLTGPRREGVFAMTFAIAGPMDNPQVTVNPLSTLVPGILREIMQMAPLDPALSPRDAPGPPQAGPEVSAQGADGFISGPIRETDPSTIPQQGWATQTRRTFDRSTVFGDR